MEEKVNALYHETILEHNRAPRFFEKRPEASHVVEAYNPVCGDKFRLYLDVEAGKVVRATFHGYGCAVSKASASVLMTRIQGMELEELRVEVAAFFGAILPEEGVEVVALDAEIAAFLPVRDFPGRLKCATLAWEALRAFMA